MKTSGRKELLNCLISIAGAAIFSFGVNIFITPLKLYNGGLVGIAQLLRTFIVDFLGINIKGTDISGIIYMVLNIPLFLLAFKELGKKFFVKTVLATIVMSSAMTIIPVPESPIITDSLTASLIGGIITGFGVGIILRAGGSAGGLDILGVYFTKKLPNFSVGKLANIVNILVFGICIFMFEVPVVIYSIIYNLFAYMFTDRVHYQNINVSMMIFTKKDGIDKQILTKTGRGVTEWKGNGAYTNEETNVLVTIINKYEIQGMKKIVHDMDPNAFIIINEGLTVEGNFEKRL